MGCGVSNDVVVDAHRASNIEEKRVIDSPPLATESPVGMNVLISCHSDRQSQVEQLKQKLTKQSHACYVITENQPKSIVARANLVRWCDVCIVFINRTYQQTLFCLETIYYAKDLRQPIIAILAEDSFQPYGGLGAIAASAQQTIALKNGDISENVVSQIANAIPREKNKKKKMTNVFEPSTLDNTSKSVDLIDGNSNSPILICTLEDGIAVERIISDALIASNHNVTTEDLTNGKPISSVRQCTVLVAILTPLFEQSAVAQAVFEQARQLRKGIIPVMAVKSWKPQGWPSLTIAGSTFFRIFDKDQAYKKFFDSNRITDLRVEVDIACQPRPTQAEREQIETNALKQQIEECKSKLQTWPPARKSRVKNFVEDRQPVRVQIDGPKANLRFTHIHHSITRMDMKAPTPLLDQYGLPKRADLDCMISYQWDNQELVRQIYEDMLMRELHTWFDIWGSMQGNTNEAMATGVECARVLLVFLSKAYVESVNCQLEFRYAVKRGKAFVIIRTEPNIQMDQWMLDAIEGFPQYNISSYSQLEMEINGVPTIDVILQAVRKLAKAQSVDIVDDCSAELSELRSLLDDARDALSAETSQVRYKTCTRCQQQFDEHTQGGCKKHRAYYMGGTILQGRWVCCRQLERDSLGCEPCDHTDAARVFTMDPSYGTWTWQPS